MIKKIRDIILISIVAVISTVTNLNLNEFFVNTIYTVTGIMFSIGMGIIVTFNLQGIKNRNIIKIFRENLFYLRSSYIKYFTIATVLFLLDNFTRIKGCNIKIISFKNYIINFDISLFVSLIMIFCVVYFIYNFILLHKLNNDIYDELNK